MTGTFSVFRSISVASSYTFLILEDIPEPPASLSSHVLSIGSLRRAFPFASRTTTNSHGCVLLAEAALDADSRTIFNLSSGIGSGLNFLTDLSELIPSIGDITLGMTPPTSIKVKDSLAPWRDIANCLFLE